MCPRSKEEQMVIGKKRGVIRRGRGDATVVRGAKQWVEGTIRGEINPQRIQEELCATITTENLSWINDFKTRCVSPPSLLPTTISRCPLVLSIKESPATQISVK